MLPKVIAKHPYVCEREIESEREIERERREREEREKEKKRGKRRRKTSVRDAQTTQQCDQLGPNPWQSIQSTRYALLCTPPFIHP